MRRVPISLVWVSANLKEFLSLARAADEAGVEAAKVMGARDRRVIMQHILPNIVPIIIVFATLNAGIFIIVEATLSFLGFGTPPPAPTWGRMLNVSRTFLFEPWMAFWPGLFLTATVFGFQVFGDALRDVLDPRLRQGR